ncbi:MAG: DUF1926 domain-containing protein [Chitinispirillaceae bacterium]|nr:DUF1926 domain-containing protein [Chitinispirillaceae bacterium]
MKRHAIAFILQPYKNRLVDREKLKTAIDGFCEQLLALTAAYPNFHCNVLVPGYILESINPLLLSQLREMQKRGCLEWLLTGYTEPFLSFSPGWLSAANIRHGLEVFAELTGTTPTGFMPPFSNWEPSYCTILRTLGLNYTVLSHLVLPHDARTTCGYWHTEHGGDAIALFPSHVLHHYSAPADVIDWVEKIIALDGKDTGGEKFITVQYLLSLFPEGGIDPFRKLKHIVGELDKYVLHYRSLLLQEARSMRPPVGLQHLPPALPFSTTTEEPDHHFFHNRLHSYDQVGILQRKMLDASDRVTSITDNRLAANLKRKLYFLQDINRYLPARSSGFTVLFDRMWSYAGLIELERHCTGKNEHTGGRIHITDFLRNGTKSIIMSNRCLRAYCDYKNGGRLYELDYNDRLLNLCATYNHSRHTTPEIIAPDQTYSTFVDRIYHVQTTPEMIINGTAGDIGSFSNGAFDYAIKKTSSSVKTVFTREGSYAFDQKVFPLHLEKVLGIEKDDAVLSFVYQLSNPSLTKCSFIFASELHFSLAGVHDHALRLIHGKHMYQNVGWETIMIEKAVKWSLSDHALGVRIGFVSQKPLDVFCLPIKGEEGRIDPSCGIKIILTSPVSLDASASWSLIGALSCKKIRERRHRLDAI